MKYRLLGNSGLRVPELSFGCMSLEKASTTNATNLIHEALDKGISLFDTADLYQKGKNEELLGAALKGLRSKALIATKVGNQWRPDGSGWDWNPRKDYILKACDESLKRLQTDTIDLYQLHGGTIADPIDEAIEAFELLKQQGKIREYGISSIRPNVIREYVNRSAIASVMLQYSLLDRRPEENMLSLLSEHNKGVLVRGALAQGLLIDKPAKEYTGHSKEAVAQVQQWVREIASEGFTPLQLALNYVLSNPAVSTVVAGMHNSGQLNELLAALEPVLPMRIAALGEQVVPVFYAEHR